MPCFQFDGSGVDKKHKFLRNTSEYSEDQLLLEVVLCAWAVYQGNPEACIRHFNHKTWITEISVFESHHRWLQVTTGPKGNIRIYAFIGTDTSDARHILADLNFLSMNSEINRGQIHAGFYKIARKLKMKDLMEFLHHNDENHRVVLCGHSLGGAIAAILTLLFADIDCSYSVVSRRIKCITFGAPLFGSKKLKDHIRTMAGTHQLFHHFIQPNDIVPCLLKYPNIVMEKVKPYAEKAVAKAGSLLVAGAASLVTDGGLAATFLATGVVEEIIDNLCKIAIFRQLTAKVDYVEIGQFVKLCPVRLDLTTTDILEEPTNLKETVKNISDIINEHSMTQYKNYLMRIIEKNSQSERKLVSVKPSSIPVIAVDRSIVLKPVITNAICKHKGDLRHVTVMGRKLDEVTYWEFEAATGDKSFLTESKDSAFEKQTAEVLGVKLNLSCTGISPHTKLYPSFKAWSAFGVASFQISNTATPLAIHTPNYDTYVEKAQP